MKTVLIIVGIAILAGAAYLFINRGSDSSTSNANAAATAKCNAISDGTARYKCTQALK